MFTKSCLIRKNTYELRLKLELIGYNVKYIKEGYKYLQISWIPGYVLGVNEEDLKYNDNISIDCGDNEELFLAIAALRDDSDKNQWFIHNNKVFGDSGWEICKEDKFERLLLAGILEDEYYIDDTKNYHKASIEELIEHFTKDK